MGMVRFIFVLLMLVFAAGQVQAQPVEDYLAIDLSSDEVGISTGFNGASFSVFGTKPKEGDLAIVIQGPLRSFVVRRKEQVAGLWMNRQSMQFIQIPVYYDLALSKPSAEIAPKETLQEYSIGLDRLELQQRGDHKADKIKKFKEALVRNKQLEGKFPLEPRKITYLSDTFFRADFAVPADVPTGDYRVRAFLFRNGEVVEREEKQLRVAQVGFSARLYESAYTQSYLYGLFGILFALLAGIGAYFVMKR